MTGAKELMNLHVEALFRRDDLGRLLRVNDRSGAEAPRFFLGRTLEGDSWWFRHDVDASLASELDALCASQLRNVSLEADYTCAALFIELLTRDTPVRRTWTGPAFSFPSRLPSNDIAVLMTPDNEAVLSPYHENWRAEVHENVPMAATLEDGKAVSICCSVRLTPQVHEAGVETHPDFRGRGYAARAVAAWAKAVCNLDRIPLYSTSWENEASRALAKRLGLIPYGVDLHIT